MPPPDFGDYTLPTLGEALSKRLSQAGRTAPCFLAFRDVPADCIVVTFHANVGVTFHVPIAGHKLTAERRGFFIHRWLAAAVMFARAFECFPDLTGSAQLWLDDAPRYPGLVFSGNSPGHVCVPDPNFLFSNGYSEARNDVRIEYQPWRDRRDIIFWRGVSTGHRSPGESWRDLQRLRLCLLVKNIGRPDIFDVGLSHIVQIDAHHEMEEIYLHNLIKPHVHQRQFMYYKYAIDIDGNTTSWPGLFHKLIFGNTVIKILSKRGYVQWYYHLLKPWVNFIPVSSDMSEFSDVCLWVTTHPGRAEAIAAAGQELASTLTAARVLDDAATTIADYVRAGDPMISAEHRN